jgi:hypothetical protein
MSSHGHTSKEREKFMSSFFRLHPLIATENGVDDYNHLCGDPWGEQTRLDELSLIKKYSGNKDPIFRAFLRDRRRILSQQTLSVTIFDGHSNLCDRIVDIYSSFQPLERKEDVYRAIERSRGIPNALQAFFRTVERSVSLSGEEVVSNFLVSLRNLMSALPYERRIRPFPNLRDALKTNFENPVLRFLSGSGHILSLCPEFLSHHAICHAREPSVYKSMLSFHSTLRNPDPDAIYRVGKREVSRIQTLLRKLRPAPPLHVLPRQHVISAYRQTADSIREEDLTRLFGSLRPSVSFSLSSVPPHLEHKNPLAYYHGSVKASASTAGQPAVVLLNLSLPHVVRGVDSLLFHEAVPGHHFQLQIQDDLNLPDYRHICNHCAFEEGWAMYAESLLPPPSGMEGRRGVLESELFRACRLVVDVGLHCHGWVQGKAEEYLKRTCPFLPEKEVKSEVLRYMCCPGQACCYTLGLLSIRHHVKRELKKGKRISSIHSSLLKKGSLPLSSLISDEDEKHLFNA